jgi:hypothetical protein
MRHGAIRYLLAGVFVALMATGAPAQEKERREQVREKDLPKPVAEAMYSHRRAIFVSGVRVTQADQVEYRLTLKGTRKTAMVVKPDGTVVSFK